MRFGARAYGLEDVERIAGMGLDLVEVNLLGGEGLIHRERELQELAHKWGLTYLVHAPNEGNPSDLERLGGEFLREVLTLLNACRGIGAPLLTVHFWLDGRFLRPEIRKGKMEILASMAEEGRKRGVQVCLENLSERAEDIQPLLSGSPDLGLTLDIGHGELIAGRNRALELVPRFAERIKHVHAHDNHGGDRVEDDLHLPLGEGRIDFAAVFRELRKTGYDGTVTLEVPLDDVASSVETLKGILSGIPTHAAAIRLQETLLALGLDGRVVEFSASTRTAREAAETVGVDVAQIAKSLVFLAGDEPILVIASGRNRVNTSKLEAAAGAKIRRADADRVKEATGFVIGGVPPVGHACPLSTFVDEDLMEYPEIYAAAGTPRTVFKLTPEELLRITGGRLMDLKE